MPTRIRRTCRPAPLLVLAAALLTAPAASAQGGADPSDDAFEMGSPPALPEGLTEEVMWPAATAEGWKKPCLVPWQRSFDDALQVARAQNRPILVAVNMDGEIASEHFAGVRYRDPGTAALMAPYACVIASVYRHTPRDYDEEGRRVECPRFGTVTCGEHIDAERELYGVYFDGRRISPRHIVLDVEGEETYDVYYSWDTATVFTTMRVGAEGWPEPPPRTEYSLESLARSADSRDREELERAYAQGDLVVRRKILQALVAEPVVDQVEVLRSAVFGFDLELARLARQALARCDTEGALDLMAEALKVPLDPEERALLLAAVERLAQTSSRARTLAALHSGLSADSTGIDPSALSSLAQEYEASAGTRVSVVTLERETEARREEPGPKLAYAEALLARSDDSAGSPYGELFLADAWNAAQDARRAGATGPRLDALLGGLEARRGDPERARSHAVAAVEGGLFRDPGAPTPTEASGLDESSLAFVLRLFGEARAGAIRAAYRAGERWPPEWLADVEAAYSAVAAGPTAAPSAFVDHYDFLRWLGASPRAREALDAGLARFPHAPDLHTRLRGRLLWDGGPDVLEQHYATWLDRETEAGAPTGRLSWFEGYASLVAAEHHRRRAEDEAALSSYGRGITAYERYIAAFPDNADEGHHFIALAHAGRARVALERGELDPATDELLAALRLRPDSAASLDGLGFSPVMTARMLASRLDAAGEGERAEAVRAALDALDPRLLEPPPSERPGGRPRRPRGRSGG